MKRDDGVQYPGDLEGFSYEDELGDPGCYPFTRGVYPTMYRGRLWTMRQYSGFGDALETNRRFRYLLEQGQSGLSIAFDLPTQLGYDSDHPMSSGEVGRVGVAVSSVEDMEEIFKGIGLEDVSTSMTINATAPILIAMMVVLAEKQGVPLERLRGTVQNDILKEYLARGNYIFPVKPSIRLTIDLWEYCIEHMPKWNFISVSGYHIREAGATAVQELAFTLTDAMCYIDAALERGLKIDTFAPRISFFFSAHNRFFEEIVKFRVARRVWAKIMKERYGAKQEKSCMLRFHTQTSGSTLTAQQPHNNIVRVTIQALAALLGGTQSLHTCSFDEALALPTEHSSTLALRTQQILASESGIAELVDPLGGAYSIETMALEMEAQVFSLLDEIDKQGGALACLENGFIKDRIEESAYEAQKQLEKEDRIVVGVNRYTMEERVRVELHRVSQELEAERRARLKSYRSKRDAGKVLNARRSLEEKAHGGSNLLPDLIEAVRSEVTLGEICDDLRRVFGTYDR
jgi:methylmalonyl-CoA mutase N-terminal domain/subunit